MSWGKIAQSRLGEIAACSLPGPGVTRFPFTTQHRDALQVIEGWMHKAGLDTSLDAAGTLIGKHSGSGPAVLIGSHQDSVRHAGRYDGIMGIALACLAIEQLRDAGNIPRFPIEVLAFADEEGVRFPTALLGPRALSGTVDPKVFKMVDNDRVSLANALDDFGGSHKDVGSLARTPAETKAYLELHIEQGPVLEAKDLPVGVVTGICGIERNTVTFLGETGHAGTVPMDNRTDALVAAADFVSAVHDTAASIGDLRATIGTCQVSPNVANGIPDHVELTLEIRAPSDDERKYFAEQMTSLGAELAAKRGVSFQMQRTYEQSAVPCAPDLMDIMRRSIEALGHTAFQLPSGATHDASAMADLCDIAMLFVRCRNGVSHKPEEYANDRDMDIAITVLADTLIRLDQSKR